MRISLSKSEQLAALVIVNQPKKCQQILQFVEEEEYGLRDEKNEIEKVYSVRDRAPGPFLQDVLGQTQVNGWSRVIASQNGDSTSYIFPLRLGVLQWSRHLFNYLDK